MRDTENEMNQEKWNDSRNYQVICVHAKSQPNDTVLLGKELAYSDNLDIVKTARE
jgi:hypothetical protein